MPNNSTLKMKMLALWEILRADSDAEHPLSTSEICRRLAERGIPCERKSVSTDVALLFEQNVVRFNTRKHTNESIYFSVNKLERALTDRCQASF